MGDTTAVKRAVFDACAYFARTNLTYDGTALHPLWADDDDAVAIFRNIVYRNPLFAPGLYVAISRKLNAIVKCSGVLQRKGADSKRRFLPDSTGFPSTSSTRYIGT